MDKEKEKLSPEQFQPVDLAEDKSEELTRPELSYWQDAWIRLRKNKGYGINCISIHYHNFSSWSIF